MRPVSPCGENARAHLGALAPLPRARLAVHYIGPRRVRFPLRITALPLCALVLVSAFPLRAAAQAPRDLEPDDPSEEQPLNRQIWEYARHTPYEAALHHVRLKQRERAAGSTPVVTLPSGWRIAPAGTQIGVGRLPCEAVAYRGRIVVLNNGYYTDNEKPEVDLVDPATERVVAILHFPSLYPAAVVSPSGDLLISGGYSQRVYRVNREFMTVGEIAVDGFTAGLACLDASHAAVASMVAGDTPADYKAGRYGVGRLAVINTVSGRAEHEVRTGYFPTAVRYCQGKLYVLLLGEDRLAVYDLQLNLLKTIDVGKTPQDLQARGDQLYVVNSGSDSVSVVDTRRDAVVGTIDLSRAGMRCGAAPTSCAVDGRRLYVALAGTNSIAVVDVATGHVAGYMPTGWYPTKVLAGPDRLFVLSAKGIRARRPNVDGPQAPPRTGGSQYVLNLLYGSLGVIAIDRIPLELPAWTRSVQQGSPLFGAPPGPRPDIRYVFYIVRENRTYDQVLGDLGRGNGDPYLTVFGGAITPNGHRIATQYVTLDNYYTDGEISVLGHSFTTSGYASPFLEWLGNVDYSGRFDSYPFGTVPAVTSPAYLWDDLDRQHMRYKIFGENYFLYTRGFQVIRAAFGSDSEMERKFYAQMMRLASRVDRGNAFFQFARGYAGRADTPEQALALLDDAGFADKLSTSLVGDGSLAAALSAKPGLKRALADYLSHYALDYRSWDLHTSDLDRAAAWRDDFRRQLRSGRMPQLEYLWLPNDHTAGTNPAFLAPDQLVAQNDVALARIIQTIATSPIWKQSLILVTEDDGQAGPDHVDATRSVALAAGPWVKRGAVVSERYDQLSLLRTAEVALGLPPLNRMDGLAAPMFGIFAERPDYSVYAPAPPSAHLAAEDRARDARWSLHDRP